MLAPNDRRHLMGSLRPPEGYRLDGAIGTTFTLDLLALLMAPVAFSLFDWTDTNGRIMAEPLALLESIRRHGKRLCLFHQAGYTKIPQNYSPLFGYLEGSVFPVQSPSDKGLFHPKLWVLRFEPENEGEPVCYRMLCLSRNLTFDRSWDTSLVLEGFVTSRQNAFSESRPLGDFIAQLPQWVLPKHPVPDRVHEQIAQAQHELNRVRWELPSGFDKIIFHPMIPSRNAAWPFDGKQGKKILVISPFLGASFSRHLGGHHDVTLVSRSETLAGIEPKNLKDYQKIYTLRETALPEPTTEDESSVEGHNAESGVSIETPEVLSGLHAKLYVVDRGWEASVWTGSANATEAALCNNVEFMVELQGKRSICGVDAILKMSGPKEQPGFLDLLQAYQSGPIDPSVVDAEDWQNRVDAVRRKLIAFALEAIVSAEDEGKFTVTLSSEADESALPVDEVKVTCRPLTLGEGHAVNWPLEMGDGGVVGRFQSLALESLTPFFAFKIADKRKEQPPVHFVLHVPLNGAPKDRYDRILHQILGDKNQVLRLLILLLSGDGNEATGVFPATLPERRLIDGSIETSVMAALSEVPLFEIMLHSLHEDPARLDRVESLMNDLKKDPEKFKLMPEGLEELWKPIAQTRNRLRAQAARKGKLQ